MKKALFCVLTVGLLFLLGCKNEQNPSETKFGAFNDETYVWEQFQFPTNRVMDAR